MRCKDARVRLELVRAGAVSRPAARGRARAGGSRSGSKPPRPEAAPLKEDDRILALLPRTALPALARLHHKDHRVRAQAAREVGRLGDAAVGDLLPLLDDPEEAVRVATAQALGDTGGPRCARPLGCALLDESKAVRDAARQALVRVGIAEDTAVEKARTPREPVDGKAQDAARRAASLDRLTRALFQAVHRWRRTAAQDLGRLRGAEAAEMVLALLADHDDSVVEAAAEAAAAQQLPAAVELLWKAASEERDALEQAARRRKLHAAIATILLSRADHADAEIRAHSQAGLSRLCDQGGLDVIRETVFGDSAPLAVAAARFLLSQGGAANQRFLIDALAGSDRNRTQLASLLAGSRNKRLAAAAGRVLAASGGRRSAAGRKR